MHINDNNKNTIIAVIADCFMFCEKKYEIGKAIKHTKKIFKIFKKIFFILFTFWR